MIEHPALIGALAERQLLLIFESQELIRPTI